MRRLPAVWQLALAQTIVWAGLFYSFPALILRWETDFGWAKAELTGAVTLSIGLSAVFSPLAGRLIDRGLGPQVLAGGALAGGLCIALLGAVQSLWQFYLLWCLIGISTAFCLYDACFALVVRSAGTQARRPITLITLVAGLAGTLSFPLAHATAEAFGWRASCFTYALLIGLLGLPLMWQGARRLEAAADPEIALDGEEGEGKPTHFLRRPAFWLLAVGFALLGLNHSTILNHLLPLLDERGIPAGMAVFAASMIGPMQVAGRLALMAVERHVSNRGITAACFCSVALATVSLFTASLVPMMLVPFVILQGAGHGVTSIMKPLVIGDVLGRANFGAVSGTQAMIFKLTVAVAPFIGALLWELGSYDLVLGVMLAAAVVGLGLFLAAWKARPI
ncbi:MFS transporter [Pelagibius marinus]|uniref:MFS transporter n=1 Tax=Pelagibius marinus TaxID=2762760 RepID=UPI001872BDEC|nr:MFS transporter [Pelagibius marinus]